MGPGPTRLESLQKRCLGQMRTEKDPVGTQGADGMYQPRTRPRRDPPAVPQTSSLQKAETAVSAADAPSPGTLSAARADGLPPQRLVGKAPPCGGDPGHLPEITQLPWC